MKKNYKKYLVVKAIANAAIECHWLHLKKVKCWHFIFLLALMTRKIQERLVIQKGDAFGQNNLGPPKLGDKIWIHYYVSRWFEMNLCPFCIRNFRIFPISSTLTVEKSSKIAPAPSSRTYTCSDTSSDRLTNHHGRTLHMVYPKTSRAILVATL